MTKQTPWRVLYVVSVLPDDSFQSHLDLATRAFAGLIAYGPKVEVGVVFTGEIPPHPLGEQWRLTPQHRAALMERLQVAIPEQDLHRLHIHLGREQFDDASEKEIRQWITDYRPDVVYCWLGVFETQVLRPWLYQRFPVITIQFSGENRNLDHCDGVVITAPYIKLECPEELHQRFIPAPLVSPDRKLLPPKTPLEVECDLVTPLRGTRISEAFRSYPPHIAQLLTLLMERIGITWHLIGEDDPAAIPASNSHIAEAVRIGRLKTHAIKPNLSEILSHSRLLFYPPGVPWGSGAALLALSIGIPVLAQKTSDLANFVAPEHLYIDPQDMIAKLERLLTDENFRLAQAAAQQEKILRDNTSDAYAHNLLDFAKVVCKTATKRLSTEKPKQPRFASLKPLIRKFGINC